MASDWAANVPGSQAIATAKLILRLNFIIESNLLVVAKALCPIR
jgi:hypothetical protein